MTNYNTQIGNGVYRLQFETDDMEHYLLLLKIARMCVDLSDGEKSTPKRYKLPEEKF